ncbi:MAG: tetratricopeptide repeat protein [Bacteroidetes bacterium]|nr:tetratricopeptide repeat protein [Bacteroidota bacterium]
MSKRLPEDNKAAFEELLRQYENLKTGRSSAFLEEEQFEKIIHHFEEQEQLDKALQACEIGISIFNYSGLLLVKKADLLLDFRRYEEALDILDRAEMLDGISPDLCVLKTEVFLALDQQEQAIEFLERVMPQFDGEDRIELLFELADVYDDYEEFDKIFDCLELILKEDPLNEEALYKICFWTDFTGRNEASIRIHKQIIDEYPYSELAWFNLAAAYQGLKLYEKAIDAYMYCIAIDEKMDYAYRNMGDAYIRMRKYKDAIEMLEKVLELSRPEEVIHDAIGYCYEKLKQWAQARFHYRKASHLNPTDSKLYYKVACTYHNEGRFSQAVKQLEQALHLSPSNADYNLGMGFSLAAQFQYAEAVPYFAKFIKARPKNPKGWIALIECFMAAENWDKADDYASLAYEATANKPVFLFYKVGILFSAGKSKAAFSMLELAMSADSRQLKKLTDSCPRIMQHPKAIEIIAQFKKKK